MPRRMRISRSGIELIKSFEGFSSRTVRVDDEYWVIGFGHLRKSKDPYRITRNEAEQVLREYDLPPFEALVLDHTYTPLHQGAFDALVSFAFNIGEEAFLKSDVLALLNAGETIAAAEAMGAWRKAKVGGRTMVLDALVRRRAAEKAMFLGHPSGPAPAPSAMVRPVYDPTAKTTMPRERAVVIETSVNGDEAVTVERPAGEERRSEFAGDAIAAGRSTERLTQRFETYLGEEESTLAPTTMPAPVQAPPIEFDSNNGPTPEEITKAISALVNGANDQTELQDIEDVPGIDLTEVAADDKGAAEEPLEHLEQPRHQRTLSGDPSNDNPTNTKSALIIDDLEEVQIAEEDIERALRLHEEMSSTTMAPDSFMRWGPLAFLALLGATLFTWGMFSFSAGDPKLQSALSPALLTMIVGALLFAVMAYYFFREFIAED